jgi:malate synthase
MNTAMQSLDIDSPCVVLGAPAPRSSEVLTPAALRLLTLLHRRFNLARLALLDERRRRQRDIDAGERPDFLVSTADVRRGEWRIAPVPGDLQDRRVEITGPVERKMIINALNSPVQAFMADFEDSCSPTWSNLINGQINLLDAVAGTISYTDPAGGKTYRLHERTAVLHVRPRGWHLPEKHVLVDGEPVSGALFDFALFLANNHVALARAGKRPYFYLAKLESHLEARLWNDVFVAAQQELGLTRGTIKATVLIETLPAAFEMDEILYELRDHVAGLNCGRWDYIFSFIKVFRNDPRYVLPDRSALTMDRHFLQSYVNLLIKTCHRRGAHAIGGMAAQIPIRDDAAANETAMSKVRADKQREAQTGHDGTWIAHPGLAAVAAEAFDASRAPNQLHVRRGGVDVQARDLLQVPPGEITAAGVRHNLRVGIQYLAAWLAGSGCVPLYHLMEDAATAEICRAQLWQWVRHKARTIEGETLDAGRIRTVLAEELAGIRARIGDEAFAATPYARAAALFGEMLTKEIFDDFLTLPAYDLLP